MNKTRCRVLTPDTIFDEELMKLCRFLKNYTCLSWTAATKRKSENKFVISVTENECDLIGLVTS